MFPWSAIIGLAGTAAGGIMSIINNRKQERERQKHYAEEQAELKAKSNESALSNSKTQQLIHEYDRQAQSQLRQSQAQSAILGLTPDQSVATQQAIADGRAKVMSNAQAEDSARQDKYADELVLSKRNQHQEQQQAAAERNATYAALATNAATAAASIADAYIPKSGSNAKKSTSNAVTKVEPEQKGVEITSPTPNAESELNKGMAGLKERLGIGDNNATTAADMAKKAASNSSSNVEYQAYKDMANAQTQSKIPAITQQQEQEEELLR